MMIKLGSQNDISLVFKCLVNISERWSQAQDLHKN